MKSCWVRNRNSNWKLKTPITFKKKKKNKIKWNIKIKNVTKMTGDLKALEKC